MEKTTVKARVNKNDHVRWTNYGDFSVHYRPGVANINSKVKREFLEMPPKEESEWFNSYQYFLFRRALYGLEVYSQEELRYISSQKKKRIKAVHKHVQETLNLFKQRLLIKYTDAFLTAVFPNSKDIKLFISTYSEPDPEFICGVSMEKFGITKQDIAKELVDKKCLPYNFFELTVNDDPRMSRLKAPQTPIDAL
jgi:hypothetical protein